MEEAKKNKMVSKAPEEPKVQKAEGKKQVRIVFKPGRDGEGAIPQGDGTWLADEISAAYWVSIGYAEYYKIGE